MPPVGQEEEERIIYWIIRTNTAYENCSWLASKTWSTQATSVSILKNLSSPLKLGRAACKPRGRGANNQTNTAYENCNWLASKTWSIQATSFLPLKKISLHLLNLVVPPVGQEGEERIIYWIIRTNTAYENCSWLASKTWSTQATSVSILKNLSSPLKLGRAACKPRGRGANNQTNTAYENCNWLASKTWSIQATSFLPLKKISLHLLNLGVPPGKARGRGEKNLLNYPD